VSDPEGDLEALVERVAREVLSLRPPSEAGAPAPDPSPSGEDSVALGADHAGFALKTHLARYVAEDLGLRVVDCGTQSDAPVDYPDIAAAVAREVASGRCARGIVIDGAGVGSTMAANKIPGIRCALGYDEASVVNGRSHNDANVLALGARSLNAGHARRLVRLWLETAFEGGRHLRRVEKIMRLESER
jgi:ribose 5-phosphate isomerase B